MLNHHLGIFRVVVHVKNIGMFQVVVRHLGIFKVAVYDILEYSKLLYRLGQKFLDLFFSRPNECVT